VVNILNKRINSNSCINFSNRKLFCSKLSFQHFWTEKIIFLYFTVSKHNLFSKWSFFKFAVEIYINMILITIFHVILKIFELSLKLLLSLIHELLFLILVYKLHSPKAKVRGSLESGTLQMNRITY